MYVSRYTKLKLWISGWAFKRENIFYRQSNIGKQLIFCHSHQSYQGSIQNLKRIQPILGKEKRPTICVDYLRDMMRSYYVFGLFSIESGIKNAL